MKKIFFNPFLQKLDLYLLKKFSKNFEKFQVDPFPGGAIFRWRHISSGAIFRVEQKEKCSKNFQKISKHFQKIF